MKNPKFKKIELIETEQIDKKLLCANIFKNEIWRILPIIIFLIPPIFILTFCYGKWEHNVEIWGWFIQLPSIIIVGSLFLTLLMKHFGECFYGDYEMNYLTYKYRLQKNKIIRNWIIFPIIGVFLTYSFSNLYLQKPSKEDFNSFVEGKYDDKIESIICLNTYPFFNINIADIGEKRYGYVGIWGRFYPFKYSHYKNFVRTKLSNKTIKQ